MKNLLSLKKSRKELRQLTDKVAHCWNCHQQIFFIFLLFISAGAGVYFWYQINHQSMWSEQKKKEFLLTQSREVNLKEDDFKKALEVVEKRKKSFSEELEPPKDIFQPY